MNTQESNPVDYDRKVKSVLNALEARGVPIDAEKWYAAWNEADAKLKGAADHEARTALGRLEHLPLLTRGDGRLHPRRGFTTDPLGAAGLER